MSIIESTNEQFVKRYNDCLQAIVDIANIKNKYFYTLESDILNVKLDENTYFNLALGSTSVLSYIHGLIRFEDLEQITIEIKIILNSPEFAQLKQIYQDFMEIVLQRRKDYQECKDKILADVAIKAPRLRGVTISRNNDTDIYKIINFIDDYTELEDVNGKRKKIKTAKIKDDIAWSFDVLTMYTLSDKRKRIKDLDFE